MVGRAARGNPMVFRKILNEMEGVPFEAPSDDVRKELLMEELLGRASYLPEEVAVREMRSVMPFYVKGMHEAAKLKTSLVRCVTIEEVKEVLGID